MEKLYPKPGKNESYASLHVYSASSIMDMDQSWKEVPEDLREQNKRWTKELELDERIGHYLIVGPNLIFEKLVPDRFLYSPHAFVTLPLVSHSPDEDPKVRKGKIKIKDETGELIIDLHKGDATQAIRAHRLNMTNVGGKIASEASWTSGIMLLNTYRHSGKDKSYMVHYFGRELPSEKEKLIEIVRRTLFVRP